MPDENYKYIDSKWYDRLISLNRRTGETFERLMPPVAKVVQLKESFNRSRQITNPDLTATHLDINELGKTKAGLVDLAEEIDYLEKNQDIKRAYLARIDELISNHDMLIASASKNMSGFIKANKNVYGAPDKAIACAIVQVLKEDCALAIKEGGQSAIYAEEMLDLLPNASGDSTLLYPDQQTFIAVKRLHGQPGGYYQQLFGRNGLPQEDVIDQITGDRICLQIIRNIGSDYTLGFSTDGIWSILPSKKQIMRPPDYKLKREEFIGIVCHEIGSHLLETVNGQKQPLGLLTSALVGMHGFEKSNEGRALLREQIVYEGPGEYDTLPFWQYSLAKHLSISLASGTFGVKLDFCNVYKTINALYKFWNRHYDESIITMSAHDMAWHITLRVLKGTDGTGDAYRKDIVYIEGNVKCWQLAKDSPEIILAGDQGKFNIADPAQIKTINKFGILAKKFGNNPE